MGSSVGISKVESESQFNEAIELAFSFDDKILIEEAIVGRELETGILGNDHPKASVVGEIIPQNDFYSFQDKYIDSEGALLQVPADLPEDTAEKIKSIALKAFEVLECKGLARCDFFLTAEGKIYVNEVNTFPGFTRISQYPMMWQKSGVSYPDLIDKLIELALERHSTP